MGFKLTTYLKHYSLYHAAIPNQCTGVCLLVKVLNNFMYSLFQVTTVHYKPQCPTLQTALQETYAPWVTTVQRVALWPLLVTVDTS